MSDIVSELQDFIDEYWDLAWQEGNRNSNFDELGKAQECRLQIEGRLTTLRQRLADSEAREQQLWETFILVANELSIDASEARKIPGKASSVFISAIKRGQAEAVDAVVKRLVEARTEVDRTAVEESDTACTIRIAESIAVREAQRLRTEADKIKQEG